MGARLRPISIAIASCCAGLLLWTGCRALPPVGQTVTVARIVSGQTIEVLSSDRPEATQVRLAGLASPDLKQSPWGPQAKQRLEDWLLRKSVILERSHTDSYGRQLAYVWLDNQLINEALLAQGYTVLEPNLGSKHTQRLAHAQHQARLLGRGIWNPTAPMRQTPVEFRQQSPASP